MRKLIGLLLALNLGVLLAGLALHFWPASDSPSASFNADKIRLLALSAPLALAVWLAALNGFFAAPFAVP